MPAPWVSVLGEGFKAIASGGGLYYDTLNGGRSRGTLRGGYHQQSPVLPPRTSGCTGFVIYSDRSFRSNNADFLYWTDAANNPVLRCNAVATYTWRLEYWTGAAWVSILEVLLEYSSTRRVSIDFSGLGSANGTIKCWITSYGGTAAYESVAFNGDLSSMANIARMQLVAKYSDQYDSAETTEHFIADGTAESLYCYGHNLANIIAGTDQNAASGNVTALDEVSGGSPDADLITLTTSGNRFSVRPGQAPTFDNRKIKVVGFGVRARCGTTGPQQIKAYLKIGGTRYYWGGGAGTASIA